MNKYLLFGVSVVFFLTVIVIVFNDPMPLQLMGKSFEIRDPSGKKVQTENRQKKLFIKFGYFAKSVSGFDGCNSFTAQLVDLGLGQYKLNKITDSKNNCPHHPYPVVRYKSLSYSKGGNPTLQFTPYGMEKAQKSLGLIGF